MTDKTLEERIKNIKNRYNSYEKLIERILIIDKLQAENKQLKEKLNELKMEIYTLKSSIKGSDLWKEQYLQLPISDQEVEESKLPKN